MTNYLKWIFPFTLKYILTFDKGMTIKDVDGQKQDLPKQTVYDLIGAGWGCFIISWAINIAYYKFHPSSVDVFSLDVFSKERLSHIFRQNTFSSFFPKKPVTDDVELVPLILRQGCTQKGEIRGGNILSWEIFDEKLGKTELEKKLTKAEEEKTEFEEKLTKAEEEIMKLVAENEQLRAEKNQ